MLCTPQEIEEKRRQAQERLLKKNLIGNINRTNTNLVKPGNTTSLSNFRKPFNNSISPQASKYGTVLKDSYNGKPYDKPKQVLQFYGKNEVITGTCALISEERFVVDLSKYSNQAIDIFKLIPSRSYDSKTRKWNFHINDYELLQKKMVSLQPDVVLGKLPPYVINCCKMQKSDYSNIDLSSLDPHLLNALMPFQIDGVCFGIDKKGRCLIADEMGLGKTFQALAIANYYKRDWPLLIITTSSMKNEWEATIYKYIPSISLMHTQHMVSAKDFIGDAKILIVSYDLMSRCLEKLLERNFKSIIIDESHTLKNFKAKCTKVATELCRQADRVILLSGTPALSRPSELYTQLTLLDDTFFGNFFEYSKRYCDGKTSNFGWDSMGKSNLQELEIILGRRFMIRRTKEDVLKSLPNKEQEVVMLDVNLDQLCEMDRETLNALANNYKQQKKSCDKQAALLSFFSETAKIKIPSVCTYILQVLNTSKKFIVFAHHQKMLDALEKVLSQKEKGFIRIDGSTNSARRKHLVDMFQSDEAYICALLSITAANTGITLTAAKHVLFAELHWNPSILSQAESRVHRIGQEEKVLIQYLLAPGTADDSIWPLLQTKQKILQEAGLFKDCFDNVNIIKQHVNVQPKISNGFQSNVTIAKTLDITTYFSSPSKKSKMDVTSDIASYSLSPETASYFSSPTKTDKMDMTSNIAEHFLSPRKTDKHDVNVTSIEDFESSLLSDICFEEWNFDKESCNKGELNKTNDFNKSIEEDFLNKDFDEMLSELNV